MSEEQFAALEKEQERRLWQRRDQSGLRASTGMLRTSYAGSGPVGTFRFAILGSYFSTEGFLCPQCSDSAGGDSSIPDQVSRVGAHVQVSATPLSFLEAYLGIHSTATSNSRGEPELLQVLGDSTWGLKAFMPAEEDQVFTAGGALELWMLNGTGGVGIERSSFALQGLTTWDFSNRSQEDERVPLRINFGLSYVFDNSGELVTDVEAQRNRRITRIERYGLNVNRLDRFVPALGIEGMFEAVRPYLEWSVDVPSNRQDYVCLEYDVHAGDQCLVEHRTFTSTPSRLTLGARVYPWLDGLALHAALDLGTGGMKPPFWEEAQPETPWNLYFGIAYAADVAPRVERVKVRAEVEAPPHAPPPVVRHVIQGAIVEKGSETPVANALVRFEDRSLTGMIADERGNFRSGDLPVGTYQLQIAAEGYQDGVCSITIAADPAPQQPAEPGTIPEAGAAPPPAVEGAREDVRVTSARCELDPLPKLGSLELSVVDAATQRALGGVSVIASVEDGRSLPLVTTEGGEISVSGIPAGPLKLEISAEGYYPTARRLEIRSNATSSARIDLSKAGRPNLLVTGGKITLRKAIQFAPGGSELTSESRGVIDELAALLKAQPEILLEIQSHTDDSLPFQPALELSTTRARIIREQLVGLGIPAERLSAKGLGGSEPLVPNTSDANKRKNERVELIVRGAGQ